MIHLGTNPLTSSPDGTLQTHNSKKKRRIVCYSNSEAHSCNSRYIYTDGDIMFFWSPSKQFQLKLTQKTILPSHRQMPA
uniref:Uncharacterized protein n=1 Tax=Anguilla anguilla TaxID=7936 RepID=A0A0E9WI10_ANGAN